MPKRDRWFVLHSDDANAGARYAFNIDGDFTIPDPRLALSARGRARGERGHSITGGYGGPANGEDCRGMRLFSPTARGYVAEHGTFRSAIGKLKSNALLVVHFAGYAILRYGSHSTGLMSHIMIDEPLKAGVPESHSADRELSDKQRRSGDCALLRFPPIATRIINWLNRF